MVSFYCDACTDTVKKPKLAQHYGRCHASFTCIDCSRTFYTPAEFQKHTICVSEAEKYQKKLYKGPKHNAAQNGAPTKANGPAAQKSSVPRATPSQALAPADVPTPVPASDPPPAEPGSAPKLKKENKKRATKEATTTGVVATLDLATTSADSFVASELTDSATAPDTGKDNKKTKKRKHATGGVTTTTSATLDVMTVDPLPEPATIDQPAPVDGGKKRWKKDKSASSAMDVDPTPASSALGPDASATTNMAADATVVTPVVQDGEKKKKKKRTKAEDSVSAPDADPSATLVASYETPMKKKRKTRDQESTLQAVDSTAPDGDVGKKKKAKKAKVVVS